MTKKAIILLSGGLDSVTVLAMVKQQGYAVYALSFDYGQKQCAELDSARKIAKDYRVNEHKIINLGLGSIGGSALTDDSLTVPVTPQKGIPITYVPARNTVFLSFALGWAEVLGAHDIFIGVNAVDYSGYPDCRPQFIKAFQFLANVATKAGVEGHQIKIHAPLIEMSKGDIIRQGTQLQVNYAQTVSCYAASPEGLACGECESCRLRRQGFVQAGVNDPTRYQEK